MPKGCLFVGSCYRLNASRANRSEKFMMETGVAGTVLGCLFYEDFPTKPLGNGLADADGTYNPRNSIIRNTQDGRELRGLACLKVSQR